MLVTLDTRDLDVSSRRAEAAREEVRTTVPEADSAVAAAKSNLNLAQASARGKVAGGDLGGGGGGELLRYGDFCDGVCCATLSCLCRHVQFSPP